MSDLLAARLLMGGTLAFHILFAVAGMAMPLFLTLAEVLHARTGDAVWRELARRWARGTAILFAVGAVSGTALSFELGLLWPEFTEVAGAAVGIPFTIEGFAFFFEAIFLGVYLYGGDALTPRLRILSAAIVALSGLASGVFVVAVNSFMQSPGAAVLGGLSPAEAAAADPFVAFRSPAFPTQAIHTALSAYTSISAAALGVHAWALLRAPANAFHRRALVLALALLLPSATLQAASGHFSAELVGRDQPAKLAAMEGLFETRARAPLAIGGWPDEKTGELRYALEVPAGLSLLLHHDPDAEVLGLDAFPREDWPPVAPTHLAFQVMVGCGVLLLAAASWGAWLAWRARERLFRPPFLRAAIVVAPLGLLAVEAGWFATELGRQPWIVRGVLRTSEAVTPERGLVWPLVGFALLYTFLALAVTRLLARHLFAAVHGLEEPAS